MNMSGIFKIGFEAWCLIGSAAAHALAVALVLALPALAQPEVADEERVSVEVVTPDELQKIIEEARLEQAEQPEPRLDPSVLEPRPEPEVNVTDEAEQEPDSAQQDAGTPDAEAEPDTAEPDTAEPPEPTQQGQPEESTSEAAKTDEAEPLKPRSATGALAALGPRSETEAGPAQRTEPSIPASGRPIVIPRKRVAPPEEKVVVGDRKREAICHDAARSEVTKSRPELKPDIVISSAIIPSEAAANIIVANGAAFRSEGRWYNFKFRCEADPFEEKLIAFDFLVGPAFPEGEVVEVKVSEEN